MKPLKTPRPMAVSGPEKSETLLLRPFKKVVIIAASYSAFSVILTLILLAMAQVVDGLWVIVSAMLWPVASGIIVIFASDAMDKDYMQKQSSLDGSKDDALYDKAKRGIPIACTLGSLMVLLLVLVGQGVMPRNVLLSFVISVVTFGIGIVPFATLLSRTNAWSAVFHTSERQKWEELDYKRRYHRAFCRKRTSRIKERRKREKELRKWWMGLSSEQREKEFQCWEKKQKSKPAPLEEAGESE